MNELSRHLKETLTSYLLLNILFVKDNYSNNRAVKYSARSSICWFMVIHCRAVKVTPRCIERTTNLTIPSVKNHPFAITRPNADRWLMYARNAVEERLVLRFDFFLSKSWNKNVIKYCQLYDSIIILLL